MARTSKTKIGGDGSEQGERMMRAASSGADAVQRAHSELLNQHRSGADTANRTAQVAGQVVGEGEARAQQQQQFDSRMEQDASQFSERMSQDQAQFERAAGQRDDATELEAAKAGFEKNDGQGQQEPGGDRQAKLEAEMRKGEGQPKIGPLDQESQQRLNDAAKQPLEMDGQGRWRPTAERKDAQQRSQKREDFQADTERIRAMAYRDQVGVSAQKALASGDMETYKAKAQELAALPNGMQKRYDRLMKGDVNSTDWGELADLAKGSEAVEPTLMADLKAKNFSPRVAAFVRAQVQKDALTSIVLSKGATNYLEIDWTGSKMREFQGEVASMNNFMRSNPALGQLGFIQSTDDKMRFLNVMAAAKVLNGMTVAPSPSGGMSPATPPDQAGGGAPGGPQQPVVPPGGTQVPGRQQGADAVRGARAGGASPQDALRAGQKAHTTNEDEIDRNKQNQRLLDSRVQGMR
jgi:hypothetical protein